jgi:uncharacterized membrane protein
MRFEQSIDIDAKQERVWEVLGDLEAWPQHIETVEVVELLTPAPIGEGSRVRLRQPMLPEGTWEVTAWEAPSYFEFRQTSGGVTSIAGHVRSGSSPQAQPVGTVALPERVAPRSELSGPAMT